MRDLPVAFPATAAPTSTPAAAKASGSNGPVYVKGPVKVIGTDTYELDTDHDGIACE